MRLHLTIIALDVASENSSTNVLDSKFYGTLWQIGELNGVQKRALNI